MARYMQKMVAISRTPTQILRVERSEVHGRHLVKSGSIFVLILWRDLNCILSVVISFGCVFWLLFN